MPAMTKELATQMRMDNMWCIYTRDEAIQRVKELTDMGLKHVYCERDWRGGEWWKVRF